jgi:quercetin dioxygenase-like cupin family protein
MKVVHYTDVDLQDVNVEGARSAKIRKVLTANDGAPNFTMRIFELGKDGCTPFHSHSWEHEIYVVEGKGALVTESGEEIELIPGKAALIKPDEKHQFKNKSTETFKFMCLVPNEYA